MQLLSQDLRKGKVTVKVENPDDFWYLATIVEPGDTIVGKTWRKIKIGGDERKQQIDRKPIFIELKVEKVEFAAASRALRISGVVEEGTEDVSRGSHHTFTIEENTKLSIHKPAWFAYHKQRLREAAEPKHAPIIICVFDRDVAYLAVLKQQGYDLISVLRGESQKKAEYKVQSQEFFPEIVSALENASKQHHAERIIIASPAFWNEELFKVVKNPELRKKIISASCSSADESGLQELLKRPEVQQALKQDRITKETNLIEEVLARIMKQGPVAYGWKQAKEAVYLGAVETLIVADSVIQKKQEQGTRLELDHMLRAVEQARGIVVLVSGEHEAGKRLNGIGGIAALLRYKLQ